jgi:hypothetical protein
MIPTSGEDGSTVWISTAASRPSAGVIADRNLSMVEFAQAVPRMISALKEYDWPAQ